MLNPIILFTALAFLNVSGIINLEQSLRSEHPVQTNDDTLQAVSKSEINKIARQLIAPCCWKQTVDVHPSASSDKIKAEIEAALKEGLSEEQIVNRFVAEFGERIRSVPKASGFNLSLWILPGLIVLGGSLAVALYLRYVSQHKKDSNVIQLPPMNESELKRMERELKEFDS